jgi:hypothetical protein
MQTNLPIKLVKQERNPSLEQARAFLYLGKRKKQINKNS